jgi:hypothetical protein
MVIASCIPTGYQTLGQGGTSVFFSSAKAESIPSTFCSATPESGWVLTMHRTPEQQAEDKADIQDSLDALGEPQGISFDDLKRELDV